MKIKPSKQKNKNKKENTTPTPKLSKAWANSREVIFPMQPLVHWLIDVGDGMTKKQDIRANQ